LVGLKTKRQKKAVPIAIQNAVHIDAPPLHVFSKDKFCCD